MELGVEHALVYGAIEGSDEVPLDGTSPLVRVREGEVEEFQVSPGSLSLSRATRAHLAPGEEDEAARVLGALEGEEGPIRDLILYNAALRLWVADETASCAEGVEKSYEALRSGAALRLLDDLRPAVTVPVEAR